MLSRIPGTGSMGRGPFGVMKLYKYDLSAVSAHGEGSPWRLANNQSGGAGPGLQTDREGRSLIERLVEPVGSPVGSASKRDAVAFRQGLLEKMPRAKAVLELAAEKAGWGSVPWEQLLEDVLKID